MYHTQFEYFHKELFHHPFHEKNESDFEAPNLIMYLIQVFVGKNDFRYFQILLKLLVNKISNGFSGIKLLIKSPECVPSNSPGRVSAQNGSK